MTNTIYMGWDSRDQLAYDVAEYSIRSRAAEPVSVLPLKQHELRTAGYYWRAPDYGASTEFSITRFLVPTLHKHNTRSELNHWVLFCDSDVLFLTDPNEIFELADDRYAVMVVKHDHRPTGATKMYGAKQEYYPRKNWSSVVLWNCDHTANHLINLGSVNDETPAYLHRFLWLDDDEIGELPSTWNHLAGETRRDGIPNLVHYTNGLPVYGEYRYGPLASLWKQALIDMYSEEVDLSEILDYYSSS